MKFVIIVGILLLALSFALPTPAAAHEPGAGLPVRPVFCWCFVL